MAWMTQTFGALSGLSLAAAYLVAHDAYEPEPIHLEVAKAEYVEIDGIGHMRQQIVSTSGKPVPAVWTASITRLDARGAGHVLCSGTGGENRPGQYNGDIEVYDLSEWTGDDCSDSTLSKGDFAEATWTYVNEYGVTVTIGTKIEVER